jgi:hypothetical protein
MAPKKPQSKAKKTLRAKGQKAGASKPKKVQNVKVQKTGSKKQGKKVVVNPFLQDNHLETWLELDKSFIELREQSLKTFLKDRQQEARWKVWLHDTFLGFSKGFAQHASVYSVVAVLLLGGITASALELFAPEDLKPSRIFEPQPVQVEDGDDPIELDIPSDPLLPGEDAEVLVIPECDLALRVRRQVFDYEFRVRDLTKQNQSRLRTDDSVLDRALSISYQDDFGQERFLFLMCIDTRTISFVDDERANQQLRDITAVTEFQDIQPVDQACDGLYLTDGSCDTIDFIQQGSTQNADTAYLFGTRRRAFLIQTNVSELRSFVDQIQFDSLAPSVPTLDLEELIMSSEDTVFSRVDGPTEPFVVDEFTDVALYSGCDLAVRFDNQLVTLDNAVSIPIAMDASCVPLAEQTQGEILDELGQNGFSPVELPIDDIFFLESQSKQFIESLYISNQILREDTGNPNLYDATQIAFFTDQYAYQLGFFYNEPSQLFNYTPEDLYMQFDSLAPSEPSIVIGSSEGHENKEKGVYRNEFYPDLRLSYDSSWVFETTTEDTVYPELLARRLFLRKGDSVAEIVIRPFEQLPCESGAASSTTSSVSRRLMRVETDSGEYRYIRSGQSLDETCIERSWLPLSSNIATTDIPSYQAANPGDAVVQSLVEIKVTSSNEAELEQIDQIIRGSSLFSR